MNDNGGILSVVTPAFEAGEFLPENVASVARLGVPHEHIVVDGGSGDGTVDFLRDQTDPALRWVSEPDRGQTHAVNKGIAMARGEFLAWLNADDAYIPGAVESAIALLRRDSDVDAVFGFMEVVDERGAPIRTFRCGPFIWYRYLYVGGYVPTPTIIFRRTLLGRAPQLDESFADAADYDFYLRLLRGARVRRVRTPIVRFRYHAGSKTASQAQLQLSEGMAIRLREARNPLERALIRILGRVRRMRDRVLSPWPDLNRQDAPEPPGQGR